MQVDIIEMLGLGKIKEAKEKAEKLKVKLAAMDFEGWSYNNKVSIKCTGDKRFHSLEIDDSIFKIRSREEVQDMILEAIDRAQMQADNTIKDEMAAIMPNIPGMGL
ncbi:YbaB/EbfC family nucleoid-associated protein [Bacteroidia bacterium]|nr:YbaB/EbfC family nucleoid-associated protein [Bacteroidia bacterium]MDB4174411.1 YbaB/EbfC family nucleoid-associated protein [Bacteroidia bacterium]